MRAITSAFVVAVLVAIAAPAVAQDKAAEGAKVYAASKCSMCHSIEGQGNKKFPLDGVGATITPELARLWLVNRDEAVKRTGKTGTPKMRAYDQLPAAEVDALVAYILSLR